MSASEFHAACREFAERPARPDEVWLRAAPVSAEVRRVIRCSPQNADRAIARAISRAVVLGELWLLEVSGDEHSVHH